MEDIHPEMEDTSASQAAAADRRREQEEHIRPRVEEDNQRQVEPEGSQLGEDSPRLRRLAADLDSLGCKAGRQAPEVALGKPCNVFLTGFYNKSQVSKKEK